LHSLGCNKITLSWGNINTAKTIYIRHVGVGPLTGAGSEGFATFANTSHPFIYPALWSWLSLICTKIVSICKTIGSLQIKNRILYRSICQGNGFIVVAEEGRQMFQLLEGWSAPTPAKFAFPHTGQTDVGLRTNGQDA